MSEDTPLERTPRRRRRGLVGWAFTAVLVGLLVVAFTTRFGADPRIVNSPLIGAPMPSLELAHLNGQETLRLTDLQGDIVVVNFWASWCIPCRAEHGYLTEANRVYRDQAVRFVGIVHQDKPSAARAFLDERGWGGKDYLHVVDPDSRAAVEFGVFGVPETFFVDRQGNIAAKIAGPLTDASLAGTLERLLSGS